MHLQHSCPIHTNSAVATRPIVPSPSSIGFSPKLIIWSSAALMTDSELHPEQLVGLVFITKQSSM